MKEEYTKLRVGLIGVGLEAYWEQFDGLRGRLIGQLFDIETRLTNENRNVINIGLVDTPDKAIEAGHASRKHDIDLLLIYVSTYALSATVLPLILREKVPVVLLNLAPKSAIEYGAFNSLATRRDMTKEWLAYCSSCPVPEIANVLKRLDIPFRQVTGLLEGDSQCWAELNQWLKAAAVVKSLAHSRLGLLGHYYSGMLDVATDLVQVSGRFGVHVENLEVEELSSLRSDIPLETIESKVTAFRSFFDIQEDCAPEELKKAASTAIALDRFVAANDLDLLAYYYKGSGVRENEETMSSIILGTSMLTGRGIPVAGEFEIKNVLAMKIMDLLGGGGSFSEYYAVDFDADVVLMGHDGPGHIGIAQDKIRVRPLQVYHGKVGSGLSVEMSVAHGPVTLLSVIESRVNGFSLLVAEGESVAGEILEIGNTNSRYRFPMGARRFIEAWNSHGPAHHCAIARGHLAGQIEKIANLLEIGFINVG
jgi:L-arabinose isomerase